MLSICLDEKGECEKWTFGRRNTHKKNLAKMLRIPDSSWGGERCLSQGNGVRNVLVRFVQIHEARFFF